LVFKQQKEAIMSGSKYYNPLDDPNPIPIPDPIPTPEPEPTPEPLPGPTPDPGDGGGGEVPEQIKDALSIGYIYTIASSPAVAMANLYQHQVNHARRLDTMAEASLGAILKDFATTDPVEVLSISKLFKGDADSNIASLLAQLSAGQEAGKIAQSTPGDLSVEVNKLGATIASLQALIGELKNLVVQSARI
jgi:hypothetical protein